MRKYIAIAVDLLALVGSASWSTPVEFENAMTNALHHKEILISAAFTNELQRFISSPLSSELKPIAELVDSVSYLTMADLEAQDTLQRAFTSASNSIDHASVSSWTYWAAHLQLYACHQVGNDPRGAYCVVSNVVERLDSPGFPTMTNCMAQAFLQNANVTNLTFRQAFVFAKALGAAQNVKDAEARSLCGNLPAFCLREVEEMISSR